MLVHRHADPPAPHPREPRQRAGQRGREPRHADVDPRPCLRSLRPDESPELLEVSVRAAHRDRRRIPIAARVSSIPGRRTASRSLALPSTTCTWTWDIARSSASAVRRRARQGTEGPGRHRTASGADRCAVFFLWAILAVLARPRGPRRVHPPRAARAAALLGRAVHRVGRPRVRRASLLGPRLGPPRRDARRDGPRLRGAPLRGRPLRRTKWGLWGTVVGMIAGTFLFSRRSG